MPISLDPKANFVTQQGVWSNQFLGPLTDKRIEHYRRLGFYGESGKLAQLKLDAAKRRAKLTRAKKLEKLFAQF